MPRLYTLEEAKLVLATNQCALGGHDYDVLTTLNGPHGLLCSRCGASWKVNNPIEPKERGDAEQR